MLVWAVFGACPPSNSMFFRCFFGLVRRSVFSRDVSAGLLVFALSKLPFFVRKCEFFGLARTLSSCQRKIRLPDDFFLVNGVPSSPWVHNWDHFCSLLERSAAGRISRSGLFFACFAPWMVFSVFRGCLKRNHCFCCPRYLRLLAWKVHFCSVRS